MSSILGSQASRGVSYWRGSWIMVASITKFFAEPCRTCWATPTHPRQRVFRRCPSSGDDRLPISSSSRAGLTRHDSRPRQAVTGANSTFVTPRHLIVVDVVQMMTEIEGARSCSSLLPLNAILSAACVRCQLRQHVGGRMNCGVYIFELWNKDQSRRLIVLSRQLVTFTGARSSYSEYLNLFSCVSYLIPPSTGLSFPCWFVPPQDNSKSCGLFSINFWRGGIRHQQQHVDRDVVHSG